MGVVLRSLTGEHLSTLHYSHGCTALPVLGWSGSVVCLLRGFYTSGEKISRCHVTCRRKCGTYNRSKWIPWEPPLQAIRIWSMGLRIFRLHVQGPGDSQRVWWIPLLRIPWLKHWYRKLPIFIAIVFCITYIPKKKFLRLLKKKKKKKKKKK